MTRLSKYVNDFSEHSSSWWSSMRAVILRRTSNSNDDTCQRIMYSWDRLTWSELVTRSQSARRPASISRESMRSFTWILLCPKPLVLSDTDNLTERKCGLECNLRAGPMTPRRQGRRSGRCWQTVTTRRSRDLRRKKTTQCSWPPKRTRTTEVAKKQNIFYDIPRFHFRSKKFN